MRCSRRRPSPTSTTFPTGARSASPWCEPCYDKSRRLHRGGVAPRQVVLSFATDLNETVVGLARDLIRIPSLTAITPDLRHAAASSLKYIKDFAEAAGGRCTWLTYEGGHPRWGYPVDNLH